MDRNDNLNNFKTSVAAEFQIYSQKIFNASAEQVSNEIHCLPETENGNNVVRC